MVPKDAKKKLFFTSSQDQRLTTVESTRVVRVRVCVCVCVYVLVEYDGLVFGGRVFIVCVFLVFLKKEMFHSGQFLSTSSDFYHPKKRGRWMKKHLNI